jgi:hypothetical protein
LKTIGKNYHGCIHNFKIGEEKMILKYGEKEMDFGEIQNLTQIKEGFHIIDSKNLYRVNGEGELVLLDEKTWNTKLKEGDKLEAISEFSLG